MQPKPNLSEHFIMLALFFLNMRLVFCLIIFMSKYSNLPKVQRLQIRKFLFPFDTSFMDKRLDSCLSLYYECELYSLEELKQDLCELLYNKQSYSVEAHLEPSHLKVEPSYKQLTLF